MVSTECYTSYGQDPYEAMAADEWLFSRIMGEPGRVMLRLYTWKYGAITFGLNQRLEKAVNHSVLGNTPLIRRITGGRALYHDPSELTYAIAVNVENLKNDNFGVSVSRAAKSIAIAIAAFLENLGVTSDYIRQSSKREARSDYFHTAPCFDSMARYELISGGHKVVASSQRRIGTAMLQHGAIKLSGVAVHPALDGKTTEIESLPILTAEHFTSLVTTFAAKVGDALDLSIDFPQLTVFQEQAISHRYEYVRKYALNRREIIKQ